MIKYEQKEFEDLQKPVKRVRKEQDADYYQKNKTNILKKKLTTTRKIKKKQANNM